ncbi:iron-sulfur cluster assembly protein [Aquibacillus koreensis]|uniref:Iron-sulfur cluster assembly protein n=1 Tax=Aquibacillus koreensis TaxID=279446 RepID=A0A9X4ALL6_9BACI|nr:iron-sulfur cluster assembly protein [Aquibacillus koreensis]MCT2536649.1 iron-sulfur cluster assembly protein [Aquibacillus koreensis]MDC3422603.1 iron-sulfur cluster assembly protein [Aquibacillus koreensis]
MGLVEKVTEVLYEVIDPELGINIVDLGLIYKVDVKENNDVIVTMTLTTPGCPLHDSIVGGVESAIYFLDEVGKVDVQLVWKPAWTPEKMSDKAKTVLMG